LVSHDRDWAEWVRNRQGKKQGENGWS
jgi:hypothetical protein